MYFLSYRTYVIPTMEVGVEDAILSERKKTQALLENPTSVCLVTVNCFVVSYWHFADFGAIVTS